MEVEKTKSFLANLKGKLEEELSDSLKKNRAEVKKMVTQELEEIEKKSEKKIKILYYWLFGVFFFLFNIIIGVFFYFRVR